MISLLKNNFVALDLRSFTSISSQANTWCIRVRLWSREVHDNAENLPGGKGCLWSGQSPWWWLTRGWCDFHSSTKDLANAQPVFPQPDQQGLIVSLRCLRIPQWAWITRHLSSLFLHCRCSPVSPQWYSLHMWLVCWSGTIKNLSWIILRLLVPLP